MVLSVIYVFVGHRGLILQNKTDFREVSKSIYLILDNIAAS